MNEIDKYIANTPEKVQDILRKVREVIRQNANDATEKIAWGMPAFYLNGPMVFFAAQKRHVGFYPTPSGVEAFKEKLVGYTTTKGAIQFPYDRPIPYDLIAEIVKFRVLEKSINQRNNEI